jgi:RimJ/RimL family protein N-acetyltransferase
MTDGLHINENILLKRFHKQFQQDNVDQMSTFQQVFVLSVEDTIKLLHKTGKQLYFIIFNSQYIGIVVVFRLNELLKKSLAISDFFIDKPFRNRGLGRLVLTKVIDHLFVENPTIERIGLTVLSENVVAKSLYTELGFTTKLETMILEKESH